MKRIAIALALLAAACSGGSAPDEQDSGPAIEDGGPSVVDAGTNHDAGPGASNGNDAGPNSSSGNDAGPGSSGEKDAGPSSTGGVDAGFITGQACDLASQCPDDSPCCAPVGENGNGVCVASADVCFCETTADCCGSDRTTCGAGTSTNGTVCGLYSADGVNPTGPYICKPDDAAPWDGCDGVTETCSGKFDCWKDSNSNEFCAMSCNATSDCVTAGEPDACCIPGTCKNDVEFTCTSDGDGTLTSTGYCGPCTQ